VILASVAAAALACAAVPALALDKADPGKLDPHMLVAVYNPAQIYAVHVAQGQTFEITVSPHETIINSFGADDTVLSADNDNSHHNLVIGSGPAVVAPRPLFVFTRTDDGKIERYSFLVDTVPPERADYSLTFTYPGEGSAAAVARWRQAKAEKEQAAVKAALDAASGANDTNFRYVLQGDKVADWDLLPTREVADNGTETHFHFPGNMRVPIIYAVNPDGKEAVADYSFNSQTGVATVHQLASVFHLRDGDAELCVFNKGFDPIGVRSATGTISSDVERVTR
jgi:type IV secretion system protein VirB9